MHDDIRWGIIYLLTDSLLPSYERSNLIIEATEMYIFDERERKVVSEHYEGLLYTEKKYETIASGASGMRFDAELETTHGKSHLRFLVSERTDGDFYSSN